MRKFDNFSIGFTEDAKAKDNQQIILVHIEKSTNQIDAKLFHEELIITRFFSDTTNDKHYWKIKENEHLASFGGNKQNGLIKIFD